ncbi:molybdopterin-dependent oxidoreductase [bacterium]|nr:molybdopterin-dependent oxidoreductase [bacterium]
MYRALFSSAVALALLAGPGLADGPADPAGPVVLTVTGLDLSDHPDGQATFDVAQLRALGETKISTTSIWTGGTHTFTGPSLAAVLRYLQVKDAVLAMHAINDYVVEMPTSEVEAGAPILAYEMDGAPMQVRDKGPLWVIYPYDADARFRTDTIFARSVWQLDRIDVLR